MYVLTYILWHSMIGCGRLSKFFYFTTGVAIKERAVLTWIYFSLWNQQEGIELHQLFIQWCGGGGLLKLALLCSASTFQFMSCFLGSPEPSSYSFSNTYNGWIWGQPAEMWPIAQKLRPCMKGLWQKPLSVLDTHGLTPASTDLNKNYHP